MQPRLSGQLWPPKISRRPDNPNSPDNENQNGGRSQASERWQWRLRSLRSHSLVYANIVSYRGEVK